MSFLLLFNTIQQLKNGTDEEVFAKKALWSRHLAMKNWEHQGGESKHIFGTIISYI